MAPPQAYIAGGCKFVEGVMSDWHVSASESEGERDEGIKTEEKGVLEVAGLKIPASRMMELLQVREPCLLRVKCG